MKKYGLVVMLALLIVGCQPAPSDEIVIGAILPLSGDYSSTGENLQFGIDMALEELEGVRVVYEDEGPCDIKKSLSAVQKLATVDQVDFLIGPICGATFDASVPITQQYDIAQFEPLGDQEFIKEQHPDAIHALGLIPFPGLIWSKLAEAAIKQDNEVIILSHNDLATNRNTKYFTQRFEELNGTIVKRMDVDLGTEDYRTIILKLSEEKDVMIWPHLKPVDRVAFLKQKEEMGILDGRYILSDIFVEIELDKFTESLGEEALEGFLSSNFKDATPTEFKEKFKAKYDIEPSVGTDHTYATVLHGVDAVRACPDKSAKCIIKTFLETPYSGISGPLEFDAEGNRVGEGVIKEFRNGSFQVISE